MCSNGTQSVKLSFVFFLRTLLAGSLAFIAAPYVILRFAKRTIETKHIYWLVGAAASFVVSWLLPNPNLGGRTDTFTQHAVGGGLATALLAQFVCQHFRIDRVWQRLVVAYAVCSTLGIAVELLELLSDETRDTNLTADTSWDLLANTTGVVVGVLAIELGIGVMRRWKRKST